MHSTGRRMPLKHTSTAAAVALSPSSSAKPAIARACSGNSGRAREGISVLDHVPNSLQGSLRPLRKLGTKCWSPDNVSPT
eukprot:5762880-Pyramimonas_sp.AAC.1